MAFGRPIEGKQWLVVLLPLAVIIVLAPLSVALGLWG